MLSAVEKKSDQVYRWLLAYIDENKFSGNQRLPSENALCRKLGVSRETIRVAIDRLVKEGLVYKLKGSGTYFHREKVMTRDLNTDDALYKIGLILQGQDTSANSGLIEGVRSVPDTGAGRPSRLPDRQQVLQRAPLSGNGGAPELPRLYRGRREVEHPQPKSRLLQGTLPAQDPGDLLQQFLSESALPPGDHQRYRMRPSADRASDGCRAQPHRRHLRVRPTTRAWRSFRGWRKRCEAAGWS